MGSYNSTYVGIYLELKYNQKPVIQKSYVDSIGKKTKNKFDPNSGQPNQIKEETVISEVVPTSYITDDSLGMNEDEFFTPSYTGAGKRIQTFLLNGRTKYSMTNDDLFNFSIEQLNIPKLIEDFKVDYKKYLDYYQTQFGDFQIKYGVVNYAN